MSKGSFVFFLALLFPILSIPELVAAADTGVLSVKYRYAGREQTLSDLKAHDDRRQLHILAGVDLPLGGSGRPDSVGLYYAKIGIGTPSKDYYVQVDTGSDKMWVNCIECQDCPKSSTLGVDLTLYDINDSSTGKYVSCDEQFCYEVNGGPLSSCEPNMTCPYDESYRDGSSTRGYFVKDVLQYASVSGDLQTTSSNGSVMFGCSTLLSGDLSSSSDDALDGILGFGKSNTSLISQLAETGDVRRIFAHCLDSTSGGGIFAIGHVVQPQVNTTPLIPNQPHYNVNMTAVQVGAEFLNISLDAFDGGDGQGAIIDSGTTLAYLPELVYTPLLTKIFSQQPDLELRILHDQYTCFQYSDSLDDSFPNVTLHFENSVFLKVYPHEYLFSHQGMWCIGWQNSNKSKDASNMTLLGDLVLSNKLVLYDLEHQAIGWTEYNCSSSIEVKDEKTGTVHLVGSHYIAAAARTLTPQWIIVFPLILSITALLFLELHN